MTDHLDFEARLEERIRARASLASRPFDAAQIAHGAIAAGTRRRRVGGLAWPTTRPALVWLIAGLLLAIALLGAAVGVGALLRERESVLPPRGAAGWTATGSMNVRRADHTATLLPDGRVLVAGGADLSGGPYASAELYDPATRLWTATGSMHMGRSDHTATLLRDGRVLVTGGYNGIRPIGPFASAELYDPATRAWTATGSMHTARSGHTATLLRDGRVLVAGGRDTSGSPSASAELYDPATGLWTATGAMIESRAFHTATLLPDDSVLVAGGESPTNNNLTVLSSAEVYRVATGSWTATGSMFGHREVGTALLLPDGRVLVAGGTTFGLTHVRVTSAELYDPANGSWTVTGSMQNVRDSLTATLLSDGRVLVAGGADDAREPASLAEMYETRTGLWAASGTMIEARLEATATLLPDGTVLVTGGRVNELGSALAGAELYDPGSSAGTSPTPAPTPTQASTLTPAPTFGGATNGWIAFSTQPGFPEAMHECCGSGGDIYLVREGIEPRLIVSRGSANTSNVCPAFSPDGLTLVYGHRDGASRALILLAVHADGSVSQTARLDAPGGSNVPCPRWSTDGNRLAYLDGLSRDGVPLGQPASVVVRGLDGSTVVPGPTDPNLDDLSRISSFVDSNTPLKSPLGDWAVLADSRGVIIERPDGSDPRVLLTPEGFGALVGEPDGLTPYSIPAWSPDGRFVLAMGDVGGPSFTLAAISVDSPAQSIVLAHDVAVNSKQLACPRRLVLAARLWGIDTMSRAARRRPQDVEP